MADGRKIVITLLAVLLAVLLVSAGLLWFWPTRTTDQVTPPTTSPTTQKIDLSILQRSDYTGLDSTLLQQGALPVQPPAVTGKANPFL